MALRSLAMPCALWHACPAARGQGGETGKRHNWSLQLLCSMQNLADLGWGKGGGWTKMHAALHGLL